ncbi:proteasome inhibitor pi31 subunit [Plakobranchus ocellatus]|uniref:Proteasome inhibitor PI31 subunit n=1 Tax=Plakobranchus ocellatus TaxID=259542 RepID=A0AAV3YT32_9GAST|nr:proteasome inhibitor pi31 subunit [Plakobranchus ocellatus]
MALLGFELLFLSVREQIQSNDDAAMAAVHWNLIFNGLKCCGAGDTWPNAQSESHHGSEALPSGWNHDSSIYTLRYVDPSSNRTYLMKALTMDGSLILNLVRCFDEKAVSTTIRSRDYVTGNKDSVESAYRALSVLNSQLDKQLYKRLVDIETGQKSARASASDTSARTSTGHSSRHDPPERSPLIVEPPRRSGGGSGVGYIPPRNPLGPNDPFNIGGADLDPFGRGGGMFMDPRNFPRPGFFPGGQPQPGFPPGSVPPGARFDPVGPPGVRPQPDPDHERRPDGYDDMFM